MASPRPLSAPRSAVMSNLRGIGNCRSVRGQALEPCDRVGVSQISCGKPRWQHALRIALRALGLGVATLSLCSVWATSASAQGGVRKPPDFTPHQGEAADPAVWPTSVGRQAHYCIWQQHDRVLHGRARRAQSRSDGGPLPLPRRQIVTGVKLAAPESVHFSAGLNRGVPLAHSVAERFEVSACVSAERERTRDWRTAGDDWALVYLQDALPLKPIPVRSLSQ